MKRKGIERGLYTLAGAAGIGLLLAGPVGAAEAPDAAGANELRVLRPADLSDLPLLVAERKKLIEKHADMIGLGKITVRWLPPGKTAATDALGGGSVDLAALDIGAFVAAWDQKLGAPGEVRGLGAVEQMPYELVTRNPAIHTILDFGPKDRIAVPPPAGSGPALMLEMAAAQQWGPAQFNKLDALTVVRPDAEAAQAITSDKGELDAHFSRMPFSDDELGDDKVHRVMDSFDIAGPHTATVLVATKQFHDANPQLCSAVLAALEEADKLIRDNPGEAAETYVSMLKDSGLTVEDMADMIGDPDLGYATAPAGIKHLLDFLQQTGRLKHQPASWKELFFSEAQNLPGS